MRIAVVGLGSVGETCAHALVSSEVARRLVLVNRTVDVADAIARDLRQARAWGRRLETETHSLREPGVLAGCDLVVLTLGPRLRGAESRRDVATKALAMYRGSGLIDRLQEVENDESPSVLVVTNPVEVATTWLLEATGIDRRRVFGLGTTVESARLSQHLAALLDVDARSAWVHVLGEHGSGIVIPDHGRLAALEDRAELEACVSNAKERTLADAKTIRRISEQIGERRAEDLCKALKDRWTDAPEEALAWLRTELASHLSPPATRFAIAAAVVSVARAIGNDADRVMTVAAMPPAELELPQVAISLPFAVRRGGLGRCVLHTASDELTNVATQLRDTYDAAVTKLES